MGMEELRKYADQLSRDGFLDPWPPIGTVIPAEEDRYARPKESVTLAGRSLSSQFRDRKKGLWPPMFRLGDNSVANLLSHILILNASREVVTDHNTKQVAQGSRKGRKPRKITDQSSANDVPASSRSKRGRKPKVGGTSEQLEAR